MTILGLSGGKLPLLLSLLSIAGNTIYMFEVDKTILGGGFIGGLDLNWGLREDKEDQMLDSLKPILFDIDLLFLFCLYSYLFI